jgi:hypothetical protein
MTTFAFSEGTAWAFPTIHFAKKRMQTDAETRDSVDGEKAQESPLFPQTDKAD